MGIVISKQRNLCRPCLVLGEDWYGQNRAFCTATAEGVYGVVALGIRGSIVSRIWNWRVSKTIEARTRTLDTLQPCPHSFPCWIDSYRMRSFCSLLITTSPH